MARKIIKEEEINLDGLIDTPEEVTKPVSGTFKAKLLSGIFYLIVALCGFIIGQLIGIGEF